MTKHRKIETCSDAVCLLGLYNGILLNSSICLFSLHVWNVKQVMVSHCTLPARHSGLRQQHARCQYGTWTRLGSVGERTVKFSFFKNQNTAKQQRLVLRATGGRCSPEICRSSPCWGPPHFAGWFHCTQSPWFVFRCLEQQTAPAPERGRMAPLIPRAPASLLREKYKATGTWMRERAR